MKNKILSVLAGSVLLSQQASAAVPTEVTTMMTDITSDVGTVMTACVGIFIAVRGGTAIFKVVRKFVGAAGA